MSPQTTSPRKIGLDAREFFSLHLPKARSDESLAFQIVKSLFVVDVAILVLKLLLLFRFPLAVACLPLQLAVEQDRVRAARPLPEAAGALGRRLQPSRAWL